MQTATKISAERRHVVRVVPAADDTYAGTPGPFVVFAASPRGAFRKVRNLFAHSLTDHVSREYRALECDGIVSNRIGRRLVCRQDDLRQPYAGVWGG